MIPDNYDLWERHDREMEQKLAERPICDDCGRPIQDEHYFEVEGDILCEDCMCHRYRRELADY